MRYIALYTYIILLFTLVSCVPTKDLIYLQNKENSEKGLVVNEISKKPYRIQVNDLLVITIKTIDPRLSELFTPSAQNATRQMTEQNVYFEGFGVNDHGNIRIPLLGEVNVLGFTLEEIREKIEKQLLKEYFTEESSLFVNVKLGGIRYTVNGEVNKPGINVLYQDRATVLDAIASAGDITMIGNRKNVKIIRQYPYGVETHKIDLTDADALKSPYFYIQPNDHIYVEPLPQKSWGTGSTGLQSMTTLISVLSLITTTILLIKK